MRKKLMLILCLILCAGMLAACSGGNQNERFPVISTQSIQNYNTTAATDAPSVSAPETQGESLVDELTNFDDGAYDPASEEDEGEPPLSGSVFDNTYAPIVEQSTPTVAPTVNSQYAGASPVVIDPIDKPTPTPLPPITFAYQTYNATKLHLSFDAPAGWIVDDSASDTYILTQPANEAVPEYTSMITVRVTTVSSQYNASDLAREVKQMLETIGANGTFSSFSESLMAERTLLGKTGVYANYTAVTTSGAEAAGRVHATCIDKTLYTVHITYPRGYRDTYVDQVYDKFRSTVQITQ